MTYQQWKQIKSDDWKTAPIHPLCQYALSFSPLRFCDKPTVKAYPAMGGGWQSLCDAHGAKHTEAFDVYELIANGETWE